jgi:cell division protein FtsX
MKFCSRKKHLAHVRLELESLRIVASLLDELPLKNPYEILPRKEADLARVRHEIESLKVVAPLLSEESAFDKLSKSHPVQQRKHWTLVTVQRRPERAICFPR